MNIYFKHIMIIRCLDMILNMTSEKIKYDVYSKDVINNINLLITTLVALNNNIHHVLSENNILENNIEELAKHFEDIVYCYEKNDSDSIKNIFNEIKPKFKKIYRELYTYFSKE